MELNPTENKEQEVPERIVSTHMEHVTMEITVTFDVDHLVEKQFTCAEDFMNQQSKNKQNK